MKFCTFAQPGRWLLAAGLLLVSIEALAQDESPAATKQYNLAVGLHNSEAYDLAADEWQKFIKNYEKDRRAARAKHYLGVCYSKLGKLEEAEKSFSAVIAGFPDFKLLAETYLNLGLTQYNMAHGGNAEKYAAAAKTFNTLATKYPQGKHVAEAVFYEGEALYNSGKKKEAAAKYAQMVKNHAGHDLIPRTLFALGVAQTELGQHAEAIKTYDAFLKDHADNPLATEATMWRGESLYALKQYDEAAKAYAAAAAVEGFPTADYATVRQADALSALKQFAEAAALYASVPAKFKDSQYAGLCNLEAGKKYYTAGDLDNAQLYLNKVIAAAGPSAPEAAHWVAKSLLKQKKPAEALAVVEKILPAAAGSDFAVQLLMDQADATYEIPEQRKKSAVLYSALAKKHPDDPLARQAMYMAAFTAMNAGDYEAAVTEAKKFLADGADHELAVGVSHVLAESYLLLNKYAEAEKLYGELLEKAPDDRDAEIWKVHRGTALYLQRKYPEAVAALQPVIEQIKTPDLLAEAQYRIGRAQAALRQFPAAIAALEASLAAQSKWKLADDAHLVLAYAYQQTGKMDKAQASAQKVIDDFPDSKLLDMAHYRLGECARLSGKLDAAVTEYELILKDWPQSVVTKQTLYGLGWAQVGQKKYEEAEKTFDTLIEKFADDPLVPRARYGRGTARRQLNNFEGAAEDIQAFLATELSKSEKSRARHILGLCQKGLKKLDEAVATFQKLLEEDPDYGDAANVYFELGWALKSLKKEKEAADTFAKLAKQYPDSTLVADSQYLIGDYHYEQKKYKEAAAAYYAAMEKAGKSKLGEEAAYKLGLSYFLQDDLEKAQETFNYQRTTWPAGPLLSDGAFMEAECFFKQKKYKEALALYGDVKKPSNKEVGVLTLLHAAQSGGLLKQWQECLDLATKCVEQYPDSPHLPQAIYEKGWAQKNLKQPDEAIATFKQVIAKSNREPAARAQFMIGEIQFEQKKHNEAIRSFVFVISNYGYPKWQADAAYEAARCFEVLKKVPQAIKQYKRLVERFPDSDKVPLAKKRIEALGG